VLAFTCILKIVWALALKFALKSLLSMRVVVVVLVVLLVLSALNTVLIWQGTTSDNAGPVNYDFAVSQNGGSYRLKNMQTGYITSQTSSASQAINTALSQGKSVYLNSGTYILDSDIWVTNKVGAKIEGNDATIDGNGHKIIIYGDDHTTSRDVTISGLTLLNTTIHVENTFATTIQDSIFENTSTAIEFANTQTWSEYNKIDNCQFINFTEGIVFRTPSGNATGSYSSSEINRCSFNLIDGSVGIKVERKAEFSDSQIQNVRFWGGENGKSNQTALVDDGSMTQTLLFGVVFESFADQPIYMYGVDLGVNCNPAPTLDSGVSFLGNWTAKVHNPYGMWIGGVGSVFKSENVNVAVGTSNQFGQNTSIQFGPLTMYSFKPKIVVSGSFPNNETVTVRIRIEYIDNVISSPVTKTFTSSSSVWLSDDDIMQLFPSQSVIWSIWVDAKTSQSSTNAAVTVSGYGTTG
jgi:hypothetical protein